MINSFIKSSRELGSTCIATKTKLWDYIIIIEYRLMSFTIKVNRIPSINLGVPTINF